MRVLLRHVVALSFTGIACQGRGAASDQDTALAQQRADSPATASIGRESKPADLNRPPGRRDRAGPFARDTNPYGHL